MQALFSHLESNDSHQAVGMVFMRMTMTSGFVFIALIMLSIMPA